MKKIILTTILLFAFALPTQAQFFKKIAKKAEKAAEKAIERKVEQKSKHETEKAFDSTFNKKRKKRKKNQRLSGLSKVEPATSYLFNHLVKMQMETNKEVMDIDYYLPNSSEYFGMAIKDKRIEGDFKMVYDIHRKAMFTYMVNGGQKMRMGVSFQTDENDIETPEFIIKTTGNTKTILGYNCKEYNVTGKDMTANIWVTRDIDIRFPSTLYTSNKNKSNTQEWLKEFDGWAMEMTMINTSERKPHTIIMKCLSIVASDFKINSNEYQNLGY